MTENYMVEPSTLSSIVALKVAENMPLHKINGELDTEFIKRIVAAFINIEIELIKINPLGIAQIHEVDIGEHSRSSSAARSRR